MFLSRRNLIAGLACAGLSAPAFLAAAKPRRARIGRDWPRLSPADAGLDAARLSAAADSIGAAGERQGLVIIRDGLLVFERYWANDYFRADSRWRNVSFSSGKSWGATMVGRAITQRHLRLDDLASKYVPASRTGLMPETRIRHLLEMTSGGTLVTKPSSSTPPRLDQPRPPNPPISHEYVRAKRQSNEPNAPEGYGVSIRPGSLFFYDGAAADHLAEIVSAATGTNSYDYMMRSVVAPIGCNDFDYQPEGVDRHRDVRIGGSILISCRDLARLGQLYLDDGLWNGRRLIDADFIRAAITPSPLNQDYGFLWWLNTSGRIPGAPRSLYFAAGALGQFCFVVPERRLVVATMGFGRPALTAEGAWATLGPALLR